MTTTTKQELLEQGKTGSKKVCMYCAGIVHFEIGFWVVKNPEDAPNVRIYAHKWCHLGYPSLDGLVSQTDATPEEKAALQAQMAALAASAVDPGEGL